MNRILLHCFLICFIQKSFSQVIANSPYYTNSPNGYGLSNGMPVMNTLAANSPLSGISSNGLAMSSSVPGSPMYTSLPSEAAINTAAATAIAANSGITPGVTGLEGLSLGGLSMSGASPMGYGDVSIIGELPVGGSTGVAGNIPVIGYVTFEGTVPAGGTVTLASNCGCSNPTVF